MKNYLNISAFSFLFFLSCSKENSVDGMKPKPIFTVETNPKEAKKTRVYQDSRYKLKNDESYTLKNNISCQLI